MLIEFSKVVTPSKIASLESFQCFIRDLDYFNSLKSNYDISIQEYKEKIGKNFENFVFNNYKEADEIVDFSQFNANSLDDLKFNLKNLLKEGKTYLIHNRSGKGIPLKRSNLDINLDKNEFNDDFIEELIQLINLKKSNTNFQDPYIYLDGLIAKKENDNLYLKVLEIKSSKDLQRSHIFQSLWYCIGLEKCFENTAIIEDEIEIITRPLFDKYQRNNIKFSSKIKTLMSFLMGIIQRIKNKSEIPPLSPMCESCYKLQDCFQISMDKKSLFLFKTIKSEADYLNKKGYTSSNEIILDLKDLEDTILIKPFLKEAEFINKHGFYKDTSKLPVSNSLKINLKIPKILIGFTLIPNPVYHVPIAVSLFFYGKRLDVFENSKENNINGKHFSSFVIYPGKGFDMKKYEIFLLNLILSVFNKIQNENKPVSVLYFDETSKRTLSNFLFYHLRKNKKIEKSLISAYKAASFSDSLEMEGYKETGFIVQKSLILNGALTNEPYNYKLSGIRSLGDKIDGEFWFNYIKFQKSESLSSIPIHISDEKTLSLQKQFSTPLSEVLSQEIKTLEIFEYENDYSFYLRPEKEKDFIEYLSLINFEIATIYNVED